MVSSISKSNNLQTVVWFQVFLSNTNNLHTVVWLQVFLYNTNNLYTVVWFWVFLSNTNNLYAIISCHVFVGYNLLKWITKWLYDTMMQYGWVIMCPYKGRHISEHTHKSKPESLLKLFLFPNDTCIRKIRSKNRFSFRLPLSRL